MPNEEKQSPEPVTQGNELVPGEGNGNAGQGKVSPDSASVTPQEKVEVPKELEFINKTTGRQYKSLEEAEKGLKETVSYVGKLGKNSQLVEKLADKIAKEQNVSKEAALLHLENLTSEQAPQEESVQQQPIQKSPQDFQYQLLQEQLGEEKLFRKIPDAEAHVNLIRNIYKATGKDHVKIWEEDIQPILNQGKKEAYQTQDIKEGTQVLTSDKGAVDTAPKYSDVLEAWKRNPKKVSVHEVLRAKGLKIVPRE